MNVYYTFRLDDIATEANKKKDSREAEKNTARECEGREEDMAKWSLMGKTHNSAEPGLLHFTMISIGFINTLLVVGN